LHTANFSGTGVYINPVMVYNAASYQPVTAALAPGELITLFGTNLASTTTAIQGGQPAPTTNLGGVSATIDGFPCPVFAVSPGQVSIIVPYELDTLSTPFANIQLTNNGVQSNVVQMYYQTSAPGAFSQTENGLGFAAVRDATTGALIDQSNGAQANEYLSIYLTGLGTVTPTIADGAVPGSTLSYSDEYNLGNLKVLFNDYNPDLANGTGNAGTIQFAGLTPGLAGLYQINVQVPAGVLGSGDDVELEFLTESADVNQIYIPYGSGAPTPLAKRARLQATRAAHAAAIRKLERKPVKPKARGSAATAPPQQ
jgi:uncharacterized protein (TIGR03437 family)